MSAWEIVLLGVALSLDAVAVSMANSMTEPDMRLWKAAAIAFTYAAFQFIMPVIGYYCGYAFSELVGQIAPWLSFALLTFVGGKMIADCVCGLRAARRERERVPSAGDALSKASRAQLGFGKLMLQGVATSLDALAVGVTLLAAQTQRGLPFHAVACAAVIGAVTFAFAAVGIAVGKKAGSRLADAAGIPGGIILIAIGIKILMEGLL